MRKKILLRLIGIILSTVIGVSLMPVTGMTVLANELQNDEISQPVITEDEEGLDNSEDVDSEEESTTLGEPLISKEQTFSKSGGTELQNSVEVDAEIINGTVEVDQNGSTVEGTAIPDINYDLASIRLIKGEGQKDHYIDFEYKEEGNAAAGYSFSFDINDYDADSIVITATFFDNKVWDGAVDISWYDPNEDIFDISTPAQLAGLAAIVNGMTDPNETRDDQIKVLHREDLDRYVHSEPFYVTLIEQQGGGTEDIAWRQTEVRETGIFGYEDDKYNDMRYRTINITADIDMGTEHNYTPIGGKYAMIVKNDSGLNGNEVKVIDARFHGVFNGNGHTITISCNRYSSKGYGYTWNVGLIGYLGGGIDRVNNSAKDNKIEEYKKVGYAPAVRNVVVRGYVKGRRGTGGVVGRIGQTNGTVIVENCANYATVRGTDKVGCGGVVGAPWGRSVIRNCYNAGTVRCSFDEVGGIVGSNGYGWGKNQEGADIFNCFNVGDVQNALVAPGTADADADTDVKYAGDDIGCDGNAAAAYTVSNCFYIEPESMSASVTPGYDVITNNNVLIENLRPVSAEDMKSREVLDSLNQNGKVFVAGEDYPVLFFEKDYTGGDCTVSFEAGNHGTVKADDRNDNYTVPYGTTVTLTANPDNDYRIGYYTANGTMVPKNFYTVTENVCFSGNFLEKGRATLTITKNSDYVITVKRIGSDGSAVELKDGDLLIQDDVLEVTAELVEGAVPNDVNYEYTGRFGKPSAVDPTSVREDTQYSNRRVIVTGNADVVIRIEPKIQLKDWATYADTTWYEGHENDSTYTLRTARELAGMAKILCDGVDDGGTDFDGKIIKLGNDIDLTNPDEDGGRRLWRTVGNIHDTFKGTFDGCGYEIKNIFVSHTIPVVGILTGNHGGLFGFTENATIKNLTISGDFWATAGDTGVFAGNIKNTLIENCVSNVNATNCRETGGFVGKAEGSSIIRNCRNEGSMQGTYQLGAIAGRIGATQSGTNDVLIESCVNEADVSGTFYNTAGLVSICETKATIRNCINKGTISCTQNNEYSDPYLTSGGLVGLIKGALTIDSCVNMGNVNSDGNLIYTGGIAGLITVNTANIINSYNSGAVSSNSRSKSACLAGLANFISNRYPKIENCYNRGIVTAGNQFATSNYGGVAGLGTGTKIINTYCTKESVASIGNKAGVGGSVVSGDKLKNLQVNLGDLFAKDSNGINDGYPVLAWQDPQAVATASIKGVSRKSESSLIITCTAVGPRNGIEIYRSVNGGAEKKVHAGTSSKYTDTKLTPGNTYTYRVRAFRNVEDSTVYGAWSAKSKKTLLLNAMKLSSLKNKKKTTVEVRWKKVKNAAGYELYRATSSKGKYSKIKTVKVTKKNKKTGTFKYVNKKLKKNKTYYYKIRYYKNVKGKKVYSEYSAVKKMKVKK